MFRKCICILSVLLLLIGCAGCGTVREEVYSVYESAGEATSKVTSANGATSTGGKTPQTTKGTSASKGTRGTDKTTKTASTTQRKTLPGDLPEETVLNVAFDIKVMTFNVRYKSDANGHSIAERAPRVEKTVETHSPDIIGMQEVVPEWDEELTKRFSDTYGLLTHYRSTKNPEGHTILYKKSVFEFVDEGFFWISTTPEKERKGWGGTLPRIASWVLLKHRETNRQVMFFTYHGNATDEFAKNACDLIVKKMREYPDAAYILTGDFNRNDTSDGYAYFAEHFADARKTASETGWSDEDGTCPRGYPNPGPATGHGKVIDHIFVDAEKIAALSLTIDTTQYDGYFASDHYAVVANIRVKKQ